MITAASEVSARASQTARTTEEIIGSKITAMRAVTEQAVSGIGDIARSIASAVGEQNSASDEIARCRRSAASSTSSSRTSAPCDAAVGAARRDKRRDLPLG